MTLASLTDEAGYAVYAGPVNGEGSCHYLGTWPSWQAAVRAADVDVLRRLRESGGGWVEVRHDLVGPGAAGPHTVHPIVTSIGPDRLDTDAASQLARAAVWLASVEGSAS